MRVRQSADSAVGSATEHAAADRDRRGEVERIREACEERDVVLEDGLAVFEDPLLAVGEEARAGLLAMSASDGGSTLVVEIDDESPAVLRIASRERRCDR